MVLAGKINVVLTWISRQTVGRGVIPMTEKRWIQK
jgi:hypothetical protein